MARFVTIGIQPVPTPPTGTPPANTDAELRTDRLEQPGTICEIVCFFCSDQTKSNTSN